MKLFWVILMVLRLTISLPIGSDKTITISQEPSTEDAPNDTLSASVSEASVTDPEDVTTTTTPINPSHNEVNAFDDEIPSFDRNQVKLDLPSDLFSSTANLTFRLRNFIGDFITRTSVRIAQVVRFFQPLFGYHLMIDIPKELDV